MILVFYHISTTIETRWIRQKHLLEIIGTHLWYLPFSISGLVQDSEEWRWSNQGTNAIIIGSL